MNNFHDKRKKITINLDSLTYNKKIINKINIENISFSINADILKKKIQPKNEKL